MIQNAIADANLKDNAEIYLMGDFNINMLDRKSPMVKELETVTSLWGLKAHITASTRMGTVRGHLKGSCIDNIFTNSGAIAEAKILDWNFSDYLAVMVKRKRAIVKIPKVTFKGRSYRNYRKEDLQGELLEGNWNQFYGTMDPSVCWDILESRVRAYLDVNCPMKSFKVNEVRDP